MTCKNKSRQLLSTTAYTEIFKDVKFSKLAKRKILLLTKKQWLKETM